jgi:hypothetical protein
MLNAESVDLFDGAVQALRGVSLQASKNRLGRQDRA